MKIAKYGYYNLYEAIMDNTIKVIELRSESRTIESIEFLKEDVIAIKFTDGTNARICSESPLNFLQGSDASLADLQRRGDFARYDVPSW